MKKQDVIFLVGWLERKRSEVLAEHKVPRRKLAPSRVLAVLWLVRRGYSVIALYSAMCRARPG